MILKFEDYIKEGFLSKTINRSKSGDRRLEDKFTKLDLEQFNHAGNKFYNFLKQHNIYDLFMNDFPKVIEDKYEDFIKSQLKQNNAYNIGFTADDEVKMPDFEYTFNIESIKNVTIFFYYTDKNKEFKIFCGNDKEEFDISETHLGKYLLNDFHKTIFGIYEKYPELIEQNIKNDFERFKEELFNFVYDCCYDDFKYDRINHYSLSDISNIEMVFYTSENKIKNYHIDSVDFSQEYNKSVFIGDGDRIKSQSLEIKIIDICEDAYKKAKQDIFEEYPLEDDNED